MQGKVSVLAYITINEERCKNCGLCIENCPKKIISFTTYNNKKGYNPAKMKESEECTGCGICYTICPDICIEVYR